jgi:hypothetical protein
MSTTGRTEGLVRAIRAPENLERLRAAFAGIEYFVALGDYAEHAYNAVSPGGILIRGPHPALGRLNRLYEVTLEPEDTGLSRRKQQAKRAEKRIKAWADDVLNSWMNATR